MALRKGHQQQTMAQRNSCLWSISLALLIDSLELFGKTFCQWEIIYIGLTCVISVAECLKVIDVGRSNPLCEQPFFRQWVPKRREWSSTQSIKLASRQARMQASMWAIRQVSKQASKQACIHFSLFWSMDVVWTAVPELTSQPWWTITWNSKHKGIPFSPNLLVVEYFTITTGTWLEQHGSERGLVQGSFVVTCQQ